MAKTYKKLKIDVNERVNDIVTAVQGDAKSRYLDIVLLDGSVAVDLTGHEVRIYAVKPDGRELFNNGQILSPKEGKCRFELTSQALAVKGIMKLQVITFLNNEEMLSTKSFDLKVDEGLYNSGSIQSANEYDAVITLFQQVYLLRDTVIAMSSKFGNYNDGVNTAQGETSASDISFFGGINKIWNYLRTQSTAGIVDTVNVVKDTVNAIRGTVNDMIPKINNLVTKSEKKMKSNFVFATIPSSKATGTSTTVNLINITGTGKLNSMRYTPSTEYAKYFLCIIVDGNTIFSNTVSGRGTNLVPGVWTNNVSFTIEQIYFNKSLRIYAYRDSFSYDDGGVFQMGATYEIEE